MPFVYTLLLLSGIIGEHEQGVKRQTFEFTKYRLFPLPTIGNLMDAR
jgi:hypothetical protein